MMNLVDSSGWLEYFGGGKNADFFAVPINNIPLLVVPTICLLEVFKRILQQRSENDALQAVALMRQGCVIELTAKMSLSAAKIGYEKKLALADSVIYAAAKEHQAIIWTQDDDFKGLENVKYVAKKN